MFAKTLVFGFTSAFLFFCGLSCALKTNAARPFFPLSKCGAFSCFFFFVMPFCGNALFYCSMDIIKCKGFFYIFNRKKKCLYRRRRGKRKYLQLCV